MTDTIKVELTMREAWVVMETLGKAERDANSPERKWVGERLMRLIDERVQEKSDERRGLRKSEMVVQLDALDGFLQKYAAPR